MAADGLEFVRADTPKSPTNNTATSIDIIDDKPGAAPAGLTLEWRGVAVNKQTKAKKAPPEDNPPILSEVNGFAAPGKLLVVMGPSGAGKTMLLEVLSGRISTDLCSEANVTVNGQPFTKALAHQHAAHIMSNVLFYDALTVRGHLLFQARLRHGHTCYSDEECQQQVDCVLQENGLDAVRDSPIGGISAGLKKQLAVASELLGDASILIIDEPTLELDSFIAMTVITQLKDAMSRGNKTVVASISKPSSEVFALFDKILLLTAGGEVAYHGPAAAAVAYFAERGFKCPMYFSAADYLLLQVSVALVAQKEPAYSDRQGDAGDASGDRSRLATLVQAWETYRHSDAYTATLPPHQVAVSAQGDKLESEPVKESVARPSTGVARALLEFATLAHRSIARISATRRPCAFWSCSRWLFPCSSG